MRPHAKHLALADALTVYGDDEVRTLLSPEANQASYFVRFHEWRVITPDHVRQSLARDFDSHCKGLFTIDVMTMATPTRTASIAMLGILIHLVTLDDEYLNSSRSQRIGR